MATLLAGICDDEPVALNHISQALRMEFQMNGMDVETESYSNPASFSERLEKRPPFDVLFLDIDMPGINGIELAQYANKLIPTPPIIFITSKDEYVFQAFKVQPFRYIRKHDFANEIRACIHDLTEVLPGNVTQNYITLSSQHKIYRLNVMDISYVESIGKDILIHVKDEVIEIRYSLSEVEEMLSPYHFFRIHKSYLVNGTFIYSIESREVKLTTGESLPLSRYRVQETKDRFQEMILCTLR